MTAIAARVGAFAGRFHFDESDEHVAESDGVIGPRFQVGDRRFPDGRERGPRQAADFRQIGEQHFERRAKLVFRFAAHARIGKFGLRLGAIPRDRFAKNRFHGLTRLPGYDNHTSLVHARQ